MAITVILGDEAQQQNYQIQLKLKIEIHKILKLKDSNNCF